jgi:hypothetical protein
VDKLQATKRHAYETNLASEFYVLAALYRIGADATLSLGNKKSVDITVIHEAGNTTTIDVKGVAGKWDWPADNIRQTVKGRHFLVFVSFEAKFSDPRALPSVWVVPHTEVGQFRVPYKGRSNISRAMVIKSAERYRERWDLLIGSTQS